MDRHGPTPGRLYDLTLVTADGEYTLAFSTKETWTKAWNDGQKAMTKWNEGDLLALQDYNRFRVYVLAGKISAITSENPPE